MSCPGRVRTGQRQEIRKSRPGLLRPGLLLYGRGGPVPAGVRNLPSGAPLPFCGLRELPRRRVALSPFAAAAIRVSAWCRPITTGRRDCGCMGNAQLPEAGFRKPLVLDSPFRKKGKFSRKRRPGIAGCVMSPRRIGPSSPHPLSRWRIPGPGRFDGIRDPRRKSGMKQALSVRTGPVFTLRC